MSIEAIAAAWRRAEAIFLRRPEAALHDDPPATARWTGGTRVVTRHANGTEIASDMARELGGGGELVSPGWLFRAGLAACTTTRIAMAAAAEGIALTELELTAASRSDTRGMLGMREADGTLAPAGPRDVELRVRIAAPGISAERLRALVEESQACSPVACTVGDATPVALRIEVGAG